MTFIYAIDFIRYLAIYTLLLFSHWSLADITLDRIECPAHWYRHDSSCYRFVQSPLLNRTAAAQFCNDLNSHLTSLTNAGVHNFLVKWLQENSLRRDLWYVGVQQIGSEWINTLDNSLISVDVSATNLTLDSKLDGSPHTSEIARLFAAYSCEISDQFNTWRLQQTSGRHNGSFICRHQLTASDYDGAWHLAHSDLLRDHWGQALTHTQTAPRLTVQPNATVYYDSGLLDTARRYIALRCEAEAYPSAEYVWFHSASESILTDRRRLDPLDDTRITFNGGTLIILQVLRKDAGNYYCQATNRHGSVISTPASLMFTRVVDSENERKREEGVEFSGKALDCSSFQTFPDRLFHWYKDGSPLYIEQDGRVFSSHDGFLHFSYVDQSDPGSYSCTVRTSYSTQSVTGPQFDLFVTPSSRHDTLSFAPGFPRAFPSIVPEGATARLECLVYGYPKAKYSWRRRHGLVMPFGVSLQNFQMIVTIENVSVSDAGVYICDADNGVHTVNGSVLLQVRAKPRVLVPLLDRVVSNGQTVSFVCEVFGIPDVVYRWLRNGQLLSQQTLAADNKIHILHSTLTLHNVTSSYAGVYQCHAHNILGVAVTTAQLHVRRVAPQFVDTEHRRYHHSLAGRSHRLSCQFYGVPRPAVTWWHNEQTILESERRYILQDGTLYLARTQLDDEGNYTCSASNDYGVVRVSTYLNVSDIVSDVTLQQPATVSGARNSRKRLLCDAGQPDNINELHLRFSSSHLEIVTSWTKNLLAVNCHGHVHCKPDYLRFDPLQTNDSGSYVCHTLTPFGEIRSSQVNLHVQGPPSPPGSVYAVNVEATTAELKWRLYNHRENVTAFVVQANVNPMQVAATAYNNSWSVVARIDVGSVLPDDYKRPSNYSHVLRGLSPYSAYSFRIAAVNSHGPGLYSFASPLYSTKPAPPYVAPAGIRSGGGMITDLIIEWDPLSAQDQNANQVYYKVFWRRVGIDEQTRFDEKLLNESQFRGANFYVIRINSRYNYTEYAVKLQAFNSMGAGPISAETVIYSAEALPNAVPLGILLRALNSTSLVVSWRDVSSQLRGRLLGYRVKYWRDGTDEHTHSLVLPVPGTHTNATLVGLKPFTKYRASVLVYNSAGSGQESENDLGRTYRAAPQVAPIINEVRPVEGDPHSVVVFWRMTSTPSNEERVQGYKVRVYETDQHVSTANDTVVRLSQTRLAYNLKARVRGLQFGKRYNIRVLAYSLGGNGRMSEPHVYFIPQVEHGSAVGLANRVCVTTSLLHFITLIVAIMWLHRLP